MIKLQEAIKNFGPSSVYVCLRLGLSFLLNKVVAVYLGPSGLALVTNLQNVVNVVTTLSGGVVSTGVTKLVAERAQTGGRQLVLDGVIPLWLVASTVLMIFLGVFGGRLEQFESFAVAGTFYLYFVPLSALNVVLLAFVNGLQLNRAFVMLSLASQVAMTVMVVNEAVASDISGIASGLVFGAVIGNIPLIYFLCRQGYRVTIRGSLRALRDNSGSKALIKYSALGLFAGFVTPMVHLTIRDTIADMGGFAQAGLWQGMWKISELQTMLITSALSIYFLPKISSLDKKIEIKNEIKSIIVIALPFVVFTAISIYLIRESVIWVVLSEDFVVLADHIAFHLFGDVFKVASWIFGTVLIAKGLLGKFFVTECIFSITLYFFITIGYSFLGLTGASIGYFINYIMHLLTMMSLVLMYLKERRSN